MSRTKMYTLASALLALSCAPTEPVNQASALCWGDEECGNGRYCALNTCVDAPAEEAVWEGSTLVGGSARLEGERSWLRAPHTFSSLATVHTLQGVKTLGDLPPAQTAEGNTTEGILHIEGIAVPFKVIDQGDTKLLDMPLFSHPVQSSDLAWRRPTATGTLTVQMDLDLREGRLLWDHGELVGELQITDRYQEEYAGTTLVSQEGEPVPGGWHPTWEAAILGEVECDSSLLACETKALTGCAAEVMDLGYALPEVLEKDLEVSWETCQKEEWFSVGKYWKRNCFGREAFDCAEQLLILAGTTIGATPETDIPEHLMPVLEAQVEGRKVLSFNAMAASAFAYREDPFATVPRETDIYQTATARNKEVLDRLTAPNAIEMFGEDLLTELATVDMDIRRKWCAVDPETCNEHWMWGAYLASLTTEENRTALLRHLPVLYDTSSPTRPPLLQSHVDVDKGLSNFDLTAAYAKEKIDDLAQITAVAETAYDAVWDQEYDIEKIRHEISMSFDGQLRDLCGADGNNNPDIEHCGENTGRIRVAQAAQVAAQKRVEKADISAALNRLAITVEESRMESIVRLFQETQAKLQEYEGKLFQVVDAYGEKRAATQIAAAKRECIRIAQASMLENAVLDASCKEELQAQIAKGYSIFGWYVPDPAGAVLTEKKCKAARKQIAKQAELQCQGVKDQAEVQNALEELARLEESEIQVINHDISETLRESDLSEKVINSTATVQNMMAQVLWHDKNVEEAKAEEEVQALAWMSAMVEVAAKLEEKATTLEKVIDDNPNLSSRFLWKRIALGHEVQGALHRAQKAMDWWVSAMELEASADLQYLHEEITQARTPVRLLSIAGCLEQMEKEMQIYRGVPQPYEISLSLRKDLWGIQGPVDGPEGPIDEIQQFQDRLHHPAYLDEEGVLTVAWPMTDTFYGHGVCDKRITNVRVELIGGSLGDANGYVTLAHNGQTYTTSCSGELIQNTLPAWEVQIDADINGLSPHTPSAGYAGWPLQSGGWKLVFDPTSWGNEDIDLTELYDIRVSYEYLGRTPNGVPYSARCDG